MSVEMLIVLTAAAFGVCWAALGVADHLHAKRPHAPIGQPVRAVPPHLPAPLAADLMRARTDRVGRGRHCRPQEQESVCPAPELSPRPRSTSWPPA